MFLEKDEMKFAILYSLKVYSRPVSLEKLTRLLTWDENVMSYFDLTILLGELIEDGFIERLYYMNEESIQLSEKGADTSDFFSGRVPKSIRQKIKGFADKDGYDEKTNPNATTADIAAIAQNHYMAELRMLDGGIPMLELSIDAGSRAQAELARDRLKEHSREIYCYLCEILDGKK